VRGVVITGIGVVAPTGVGVETFWQSVLLGPSSIQKITRLEPIQYSSRIAGEVRDRSYEELLDPRKLRTSTHVAQLAVAAAILALRDADLDTAAESPESVGVCIGTALGGWREAEQQYAILMERGIRRVNPFIANAAPNHSIGAEVASVVDARGAHYTPSTGCPASLQAIAHGAALIADGDLDVCIAGGAESPIIQTVLAGMGRTQELCTDNDEPEHASRPFDRRHSGLVLSEGSCILILESCEHAVRRGVTPYARIVGSASSCDAKGLYGFDSSGESGARALGKALNRSGLTAADVHYVCAHANSSPAFDRKETMVLKRAFGECAADIPVSSIKGVIGHPFGASGAFQTAATALAIRDELIPPTHNLETPDEGCDLHHVLGQPRPARISTAVVTGYGYGGVNAYLLLSKL